MKKIANLVFNPFVNDSRVIKESVSLSNAGFHVEVIAHLDKNLPQEEKQKNFFIKRLSYLDRDITKTKLAKLKAYLRYVKESVLYSKDFDILHCNDLNTLPIAFFVKTFFNKKIKIVYDAHEYESETIGLVGIQKTITKIIEKFLIKYADKVICVSDAIANEYVKLYNIEKPAIVLNTPLYAQIKKQNIFRETLNIAEDKTIFLYQGGLSSGRGIEILLDAFRDFESSDAVLVFMGYGELEALVKENAQKYENIYFHKAVSPELLLNYTSSADFGISTIEDSCLSYRYCLPNKMFEYLMANVPIIVSNLPEMKRVVESNKIGVVAKENTPQGLQEAILNAVKLDKEELQNNIPKVKDIYNWQNQEKILLNLYKDIQ
ncbi:glycosyltransferase family 4 protein [Sulfurimonas sp.]